MENEDNGALKTFVRGKWITVSTDAISDFIDIPVDQNPNYPIPANTQINYDDVATTICGAITAWPGGILPHGNLTAEHRFLNRFACHNLEPRGHTSDVTKKKRVSIVLHRHRETGQHPAGHPECNDQDIDCKVLDHLSEPKIVASSLDPR